MKVKRSGDIPLSFTGKRKAEVNMAFAGRKWSVSMYWTDKGKWVFAVEFTSEFIEFEPPTWYAVAITPVETVDEIKGYDPCDDVAGFPPGKRFVDRQEALMDGIGRHWDALVTELFEQIEEGIAV